MALTEAQLHARLEEGVNLSALSYVTAVKFSDVSRMWKFPGSGYSYQVHIEGHPFQVSGVASPQRSQEVGTALEATQGQMYGFFSQLPYKCHTEEVTSVGD